MTASDRVSARRVLILDGHPAPGRLVGALAASLPSTAVVETIVIRDLAFDPNLRHGYASDQPWEPDLVRAGAAIERCDHLVVGFPNDREAPDAVFVDRGAAGGPESVELQVRCQLIRRDPRVPDEARLRL